jgi:AraC-like DNA-binding protein
VLQFRRDFLGAGFFDRPEFAAVGRLLDATAGAVVFDAGHATIDALRSLAPLAPAERTLALVRLLMALARDEHARPVSAESTPGRLSQPARRRADAVCAYLQAAYARRVSLDEVAAIAHMSPSALSRFFRHAVGRTVTEYVAELRIAAACQLLSDSDLPVATIALRCGYENLSNFNRRFRALKGMTPRDYRQVMAGPVPHPSPA